MPTFDKDIDPSTLYLRTKLTTDNLANVDGQTNLPSYFYERSNSNSGCGLAINIVYIEPLWVGN